MRIVLVLSGGMDSTTLLYKFCDEGHEVYGLGINYGQRHSKELDLAADLCAKLGVEYRVADLSSVRGLLGGSALTSDDVIVPHGHYADEMMKVTVVPNRNMLMLSIAFGWAVSLEADAVAYAAHGGDHPIYPDCRPEFAEACELAANLGNWHQVELLCPFMDISKADIIRIGSELGVPYKSTWSCYEGGHAHCGRCGTCVERVEAFYESGVQDPTEYHS